MPSRIRPKAVERRLLSANPWSISAIVLWELAKLAQLGRIEIDMKSASCVQSTALDFDGDPADEIIAATSIVHSVPLLTRDRRIRRSKLAPLAS